MYLVICMHTWHVLPIRSHAISISCPQKVSFPLRFAKRLFFFKGSHLCRCIPVGIALAKWLFYSTSEILKSIKKQAQKLSTTSWRDSYFSNLCETAISNPHHPSESKSFGLVKLLRHPTNCPLRCISSELRSISLHGDMSDMPRLCRANAPW